MKDYDELLRQEQKKLNDLVQEAIKNDTLSLQDGEIIKQSRKVDYYQQGQEEEKKK